MKLKAKKKKSKILKMLWKNFNNFSQDLLKYLDLIDINKRF